MLEKDPTTLSKEVKKRRITKDSFIPSYKFKFPYVCNGCHKRGFCNYPKFYYNPLEANDEYKYALKDSRECSTFTLTEFNQIDEIISNGLKKRSKR